METASSKKLATLILKMCETDLFYDDNTTPAYRILKLMGELPITLCTRRNFLFSGLFFFLLSSTTLDLSLGKDFAHSLQLNVCLFVFSLTFQGFKKNKKQNKTKNNLLTFVCFCSKSNVMFAST